MSIRIINVESKLNPEGINLKPDAEGYYEVNGGAFNFTNTSGTFYKFTERVKACFESKESFIVKRIEDKTLFGEYDHPVMPERIKRIIKTVKGKREWLERQATFDRDEVSHHIKSIRLIPTNIIDPKTGEKKILVRLKIKPFGKQGNALKTALETGSISACFSIRAGSLETFEHNRPVNEVVVIFTWDFVFDPGIRGSNDQATMGFEYNKNTLDEITTMMENIEGEVVTTESTKEMKSTFLGFSKMNVKNENKNKIYKGGW